MVLRVTFLPDDHRRIRALFGRTIVSEFRLRPKSAENDAKRGCSGSGSKTRAVAQQARAQSIYARPAQSKTTLSTAHPYVCSISRYNVAIFFFPKRVESWPCFESIHGDVILLVVVGPEMSKVFFWQLTANLTITKHNNNKFPSEITMDLSKVPNEKKLELSRWYFRAGFAFLPFVWTINAVWFFNEAFRKPEYPEQRQIKRYVIYSAAGALLWLAALLAWVVTFQINRTRWGEFADRISFIIPLGSP